MVNPSALPRHRLTQGASDLLLLGFGCEGLDYSNLFLVCKHKTSGQINRVARSISSRWVVLEMTTHMVIISFIDMAILVVV
jgi:hypothetical protein